MESYGIMSKVRSPGFHTRHVFPYRLIIFLLIAAAGLPGCAPSTDSDVQVFITTPTTSPSHAEIAPAGAPGAALFVAHVDVDNADGPWDGLSWETAFSSVQEGLDTAYAAGIGEVWVAEGEYRTTGGDDRAVSIELRPGVEVYGGFSGVESLRGERDWAAHPTILSGDIGLQGEIADNAYHVVRGADDAILDGFTIRGGNADEAAEGDLSPAALPQEPGNSAGGGMLNDQTAPTLRNILFIQNHALYGGGMANRSAGGAPSAVLISVRFEANTAVFSGGAMANYQDTSPVVLDTRFSGNAAGTLGGAVFNAPGASPAFTNCLFNANQAGESGGAAANLSGAAPILINCTFSTNWAGSSGGAWFQMPAAESPTVPLLVNCILWGDTAGEEGQISEITGDTQLQVTTSIVAGGYPGEGNLDVDPLFLDVAADDYRLSAGSPAVDAGNDALAPQNDLAGTPRTPPADIGAYEVGAQSVLQ